MGSFFNSNIQLGQHLVGPDLPPFVIAEMSGNHNQSLERALDIVSAAKQAGAHALKIQTYTADTMTIESTQNDFFIGDEESLWKGKTLYDLYKEAYTPWEWHLPIQKKCQELGMEFFSTPFDESAVDFLEQLSVPFFKVASFENVHLPLIRKIARTGKPLIISTGMANADEIQDIVDTVREEKNPNLILLKCTSTYPASPLDCNLRTIPDMQKRFGCQIGLSDHTAGIGVAVASMALGARVVEKHFTLRRTDGGVDSAFSLEPQELRALVDETKIAWQALGQISYQINAKEEKSKAFRRSIYVVEDIEKGEAFTKKNVRIIRPGFGLPPKNIDRVLESKARHKLRKGQALKTEDIE